MDRARFRDWVSSIDELTAAPCRKVAAVLSDPPEGEASLAAVRQSPDRLAGIVEADETFALKSRKGERNLNRRPRRRGGKARKRGLSREQVPVVTLFVSDAGCCHRPAAERVRGAVHIQTVSSRHSQIKGFLRRFRGIATKCLDSCPRWFRLVVLGRHPSPRACLAAASVKTCLRFAN